MRAKRRKRVFAQTAQDDGMTQGSRDSISSRPQRAGHDASRAEVGSGAVDVHDLDAHDIRARGRHVHGRLPSVTVGAVSKIRIGDADVGPDDGEPDDCSQVAIDSDPDGSDADIVGSPPGDDRMAPAARSPTWVEAEASTNCAVGIVEFAVPVGSRVTAGGWTFLPSHRPADAILLTVGSSRRIAAVHRPLIGRKDVGDRFRTDDALVSGWVIDAGLVPAGEPVEFWAVDVESLQAYRLCQGPSLGARAVRLRR